MTNKPHVIVILLAQGDEASLSKSLDSLWRQSLSPVKFSVRIELNKFDDRLARLVRGFQENYTGLRIESSNSCDIAISTSCHHTVPGPQHVNVVFLREGDWLSRYFLESLLNASNENVVPVAQIVESSPKNKRGYWTSYNRAVLSRGASPVVDPSNSIELLTDIAGKMIPGCMLHETLFSHALNDKRLLFNVALVVEHDLVFSKFPAAVGATYYREEAQSQLSPLGGYDATAGRVNMTLRGLLGLRNQKIDERKKQLVSEALAWQMQAFEKYWKSNHHCSVLPELDAFGLRGLPWGKLNEPVRTLAIVANFAPYAGTAGTVAAKRIINEGEPVDVISNAFRSRDRREGDLVLVEPYVRKHKILSPAISGIHDSGIERFVEGGLETLESWKTRGAVYKEMYSRAMVPHSHFLAAAIKRENPEIKWTAEFSDPLSISVDGVPRKRSFESHKLLNRFEGWGSLDQQRLLLEDTAKSRWAELLPYFFADKLIFTNAHQLDLMLSRAPERYREDIRKKATVSHHPTLPAHYYQLADAQSVVRRDKITLAYFGDFYKTRGMGEIMNAFNSLNDEDLRSFQLMVYTGSSRQSIRNGLSSRVAEVVDIRPRLDYLEFLATLSAVDCLIVNDSITKQYFSQNPFLPSKVSDYLGAESPIWAIVEPGSVLAEMNFSYKSILGDSAGAAAILKRMLTHV